MCVVGRGYRGHILAQEGDPAYAFPRRGSALSLLGIPGAPPLPFAEPVVATSASVLSGLWN